MSIKVMQLLHGLGIGGIERMVLDLAFHLPRSEYEVGFTIFDMEGQLVREVHARGMALHYRRRHGAADLGFVLWLARLLRRERVDILHAHNAAAFSYGAAATTLSPRTRFLYTEHDRAFPTPLRERGLHSILSRRTDAVVTVSETLKGNLVRWECFPPARVHVVKNGVRLMPATRSRAQMRKELGLGVRPVAGIVARLAEVKNHALLLRAWSRVVRAVPDAVLLLVGNGRMEPELRAQARELGIEEAVRFMGFRLDIPDILQALDVFVLSSLSEGLSLTLLEAEAAGLPVVATNVGGNPEVVRDGETGFLVPSGAEEPLARALARLLQDASLRARLGERGRAFYLEHYRLETMVQGYVRLYRRLMGVPEGGAESHSEREAIAIGSSR